MVQFHDEPYALWRQQTYKGGYNRERFDALMANITDWNLFKAFIIIDGCTEGKSSDPMRWFFRETNGKVRSDFAGADIPPCGGDVSQPSGLRLSPEAS